MLLKRFFTILRSSLKSGNESKRGKPIDSYEADFVDPPKETKTDTMNKTEAEYYANLELKPGAGFEQIKAAYKSMMKLYHPDRHQNNEEKRKAAELITRRLNEAYKYFEKKFGQS